MLAQKRGICAASNKKVFLTFRSPICSSSQCSPLDNAYIHSSLCVDDVTYAFYITYSIQDSHAVSCLKGIRAYTYTKTTKRRIN